MSPTTADEVEPVTPTDLVAAVRQERAAADRAEARILELAVAWAHAHPAEPGERWWAPAAGLRADGSFTDGGPEETVSPEEVEWFGIPRVAWDAPAAFAVANAMSTTAGKALIRDALVLRHRLPHLYHRVLAPHGGVPVWRARRIAQAVLGAPRDVVEHLDTTVTAIAHAVGPTTLDRLLDEAMVRLHPEEREIAQLEALDARHATLDPLSINHTGVAEMTLRGDWADLHDFDQALSRIAAALAHQPECLGESLDVRRSLAVGVLADPERAHDLLTGAPTPVPRKQTVLHLHISDLALLGLDILGRNETTSTPTLVEAIRAWCGRTDRHLRVEPVLDLTDHQHAAVSAYEIPDRLADRVTLLEPTCVFPFCTKPSRGCDLDHRVAHAEGGATCECNLTPLCRHHHQLKTHAGWRYTAIEPGVHLWSDPHHQQLLRNRDGTVDVTRPPPARE